MSAASPSTFLSRFSTVSILLAGVVSMATLGSQWWENHQLRQQLESRVSERQALQQRLENLQATVSSQANEMNRMLTTTAWQFKELIKLGETSRKVVDELTTLRKKASPVAPEKNVGLDYMSSDVNNLEFLALSLEEEAPQAVGMYNAHCIAGEHEVGAAAGVAWMGHSREAHIAEVLRGRRVMEGMFKGASFGLYRKDNYLSPETYRYLGYTPEEGLFYDPEGKQPPAVPYDPPITPHNPLRRSAEKQVLQSQDNTPEGKESLEKSLPKSQIMSPGRDERP